MRILIYGINYSPDLTGIGKYSGEMGSWFAQQKHEVAVVTAMPYYPYWEIKKEYQNKLWLKEIIEGVTVYRCPLYVPKKPSGLKRMLHDVTFFFTSFFLFFGLLFRKKYDLIITVSPPFHIGLVSLFYRFFKGARILYHVQDLQIDAAKELNMIKSKFLLFILMEIEKFIIKRVTYVSSISSGMLRKLKGKVNRDFLFFPNWTDVDQFYPIANSSHLKSEWGFSESDKLVVYSGSIGEKQGLDALIRIASALRSENDIKFIICGVGPFKENLKQMAISLDLRNVFFLPFQEKYVFNRFLNIADVHLVLQKGDASDLVMPSKLTTILSVGGLALVTAHKGTSLYEIITQYDMGIVIMPEDESLLKQSILSCCRLSYQIQKNNAREYAKRFLSKENILNGIFIELQKPVRK